MTEAVRNPKTIPERTLVAYLLPGVADEVQQWIRPARPTRKWMDASQSRYAYRCIPLSAANTMGWEILNPVTCEFFWSGMTDHRQMHVWTDKPHRWAPRSHFGSGVVTWELPFLFRTPAEWGMVITGPANHDKAGITPLDGFVRTDWLPYPFTMNWRITDATRTIRFEAGEPIARIFPYPLAPLDEFEVQVASLDDDPVLRDQFVDWARRRQQGYQKKEKIEASLGEDDPLPDPDEIWRRQYAKGQGADSAGHRHQTVFRCKPVKPRERSGNG